MEIPESAGEVQAAGGTPSPVTSAGDSAGDQPTPSWRPHPPNGQSRVCGRAGGKSAGPGDKQGTPLEARSCKRDPQLEPGSKAL